MLSVSQLQYSKGSSILLGLLTAAAVSTVVYSIRVWKSTNNVSDRNIVRVPFLPSTPLLGNTLEVAANGPRMLDWELERIKERNGKPFAVAVMGKSDLIFTANPEHFEQILKVQSSNFDRGASSHDMYADFMGESILIVNGDRWKYHRKVIVNLFSARALRDVMTPIIQKNIGVVVDILTKASEKGEALDFHKLVNKFTLETFAEIGFGRKLGNLASPEDHPFEKAFDEAHHISAMRLMSPTWLWKLKRWLNVGTERHLRESMVVINEFLMETITSMMERRASKEETNNKDILSIIFDTMESSGQTITPTDIRDIVFTGMIAGRDTTADALAWLMHVLHLNPRVVKKLREEILTKLPKFAESESYVPSMEDVQSLVYLEATIRELLRLYPTAPHIGYHCIRDTVFPDGTFIPADTNVMMSLYVAARLEGVWGADAASFVPERFIDKETGGVLQISSLKFATFSAGPRVCVGRNLAMLELKLVTACLVSRFKLEEVSGQHVTYTRGVTIGMKNPLMMKVEKVLAVESY
ncbi:Cytochrome P450 86A2 [Phytophthora citrophthora]|uniref:Cytochrome P450 86A2 n=1 Tax=Phytophthora citrophthora TaxID=4793 RepID=A0AAD9LRT0_9STRA|nr:Cytochrome P450 86A2 [Phytophthora citrophthora]